MRDHDTATVDLPTERCPTDFLSPPWANKAVKRYARTEQVVRVVKMPYEMGLLDATAQGLKRGTIMDAFKPVSGRQNMPEKDRLRHILAALYAYGCNCGPTQAARSLQMLSN